MVYLEYTILSDQVDDLFYDQVPPTIREKELLRNKVSNMLMDLPSETRLEIVHGFMNFCRLTHHGRKEKAHVE